MGIDGVSPGGEDRDNSGPGGRNSQTGFDFIDGVGFELWEWHFDLKTTPRTHIGQWVINFPSVSTIRSLGLTANCYWLSYAVATRLQGKTLDDIVRCGQQIICVSMDEVLDLYNHIGEEWNISAFDDTTAADLRDYRRLLNQKFRAMGIFPEVFRYDPRLGFWMAVDPRNVVIRNPSELAGQTVPQGRA